MGASGYISKHVNIKCECVCYKFWTPTHQVMCVKDFPIHIRNGYKIQLTWCIFGVCVCVWINSFNLIRKMWGLFFIKNVFYVYRRRFYDFTFMNCDFVIFHIYKLNNFVKKAVQFFQFNTFNLVWRTFPFSWSSQHTHTYQFIFMGK